MGFNPRARAGRDLMFAQDLDIGQVVSIHAPARGATVAPLYAYEAKICLRRNAEQAVSTEAAPQTLCEGSASRCFIED